MRSERCDKKIGPCYIQDCNGNHVEQREVKGGIRRTFCQFRVVFSKTLADEDRYGDTNADHGHEGERIDIECNIACSQCNGSEPSDEQDEEGETGDFDEKVYTARKPESNKSSKQFPVKSPSPDGFELLFVKGS